MKYIFKAGRDWTRSSLAVEKTRLDPILNREISKLIIDFENTEKMDSLGWQFCLVLEKIAAKRRFELQFRGHEHTLGKFQEITR